MPLPGASAGRSTPSPRATPSSSSWTPEPIRRLFSHFPLETLPPNRLPSRTLTQSQRKRHTLFLFTLASTSTDPNNAAITPSFNPTCLKWQTYLLFNDIDFTVQASNNHASPSGSLPFIIPSIPSSSSSSKSRTTSTQQQQQQHTITTSTIKSWVAETSTLSRQQHDLKRANDTADPSLRESTFLSLLEHKFRPAWLHCFYLTNNLHTLAAPLYIYTTTSSPAVRAYQTYLLRRAAAAEVAKSSPKLDVEVLYANAEEALRALDQVCGEDGGWFFGEQRPGLIDAAVFGYLGVLLDDELGAEVGGRWDESEECQRLRQIAHGCRNLVRARRRIMERFYSRRNG